MPHPRLPMFLFACALLAASATAAAFDDPLGLYIGGSLGRSGVRADGDLFNQATGSSEWNGASVSGHNTGWKAIVGLRPIPFIGAEAEYIDFGHQTQTQSEVVPPIAATLQESVHQRAQALFGVLYLPVPLIDVFGKVGVARVQTDVNAQASVVCIAGSGVTCPPLVTGVFTSQSSPKSGRLAAGIGAQLKLAGLGVRAEYERIALPGGNPDLLSAGVTFSF